MAKIKAYLDRNQLDYLRKVKSLLSSGNLIRTAKPLNLNNADDKKIKERDPRMTHKARIYFSGLAGLTLFGVDEKHRKGNNICSMAFHKLLEYEIKKINDKNVAVQIKIMFAYPYSNFMYDILYLEKYDHRYLTAECIQKGVKYEYSFEVEPRLTLSDLKDSNTFKHLQRSLRFIQDNIREDNKFWNSPPSNTFRGSPNIIIVKFCPINVMCCFLRINNVIFSDPYIYSKTTSKAREMALLTPISCIEVPFLKTKIKGKLQKEKELQFCSLISHFKYLWENPLTLYAADATEYKRFKGGLNLIKTPQQISYEKKGNRIKRKIESFGNTIHDLMAQNDNWKQYIKSELLINCSKVLTDPQDGIYDTKVRPLNIFIAGTWGDSGKHLMDWLKKKIRENFSDKVPYGLQLNPIVLEVDNGEAFLNKLYKHLNISQLGIIIQTPDIISNKNERYSRPNIYFEKGYLMAKLRKRYMRITKEPCESVFIFKQQSVDLESDNKGMGYTEFEDFEHFKTLMFKLIYWLWEVTTLNSERAYFLMNKFKNGLTKQDRNDFNDKINKIKDLR